ncbi:MAG: U32 family peptidase [Ruminococcaceae bacterium]|nr:U32 family peptidase [Oscillospiraceae bacterium]
MMRRKPELLAPAGDWEKLQMAVLYGADAVYLAGTSFGMRAFAGNFTPDELRRAVRFAHEHGVRVHVTVNTMPRGDELKQLPEHLENLNEAGVDALIVADLGVFTLAGKYAPRCERHVSTQQSVANSACATAWYDLGAKRVVLARELSLAEIRQIRADVPPELEIETFAHGAMCVSYSGRCLLSNYMTGRDSNRGECAQPCRYQYALMEEKRPGEYFPVFEDEKGTYIMNSRDMCMIDHLDDIMDAGIDCIKLEGRAKSEYYAAIVTGAYRHVLDEVWAGEPVDPVWRDEVERVSHRHYSTGFYYGEPGQYTESARYLREWQVVAVVEECDADGNAVLSLRNKFAAGDEVEIVGPDCRPFTLTAPMMTDMDGFELPEVRTPKTMFKMKLPRSVPPFSFVRHRAELSGK